LEKFSALFDPALLLLTRNITPWSDNLSRMERVEVSLPVRVGFFSQKYEEMMM